MKPRNKHGLCLNECPYFTKSKLNLNIEFGMRCSWLGVELSYYDGFLTEPICEILSWGQSVLVAHQEKCKIP